VRGDRLRQPRVRRKAADLEHDQPPAPTRRGGDRLEPLAGRRHERVRGPHHRRPRRAGEQRHRGRLVEHVPRVEFTVAGEFPPRPGPIILVRTQPLPQRGEHLAGEERLVAVYDDDRGRPE
jgi:hypothetical protein